MSNWTIGYEKIKNFLEESDYYMAEDGHLEAVNDFVLLRCGYNPVVDKYELNYALKIYFDRWSNSGYEKEFDNEDELIDFLKDERELISNSILEMVYAVVEEKLYEHKRDELKNFTYKIYDMMMSPEIK